jgi:AraC-like DNA-binding protein
MQSTSAFVEAFRKSFGMTPKAWNDVTAVTEPKKPTIGSGALDSAREGSRLSHHGAAVIAACFPLPRKNASATITALRML